MSKVKVADDTVNLRRGVDHIGITVNFLIHDGKGKILLHKRSKNCRDEQGRWDVGGGAVEFGETLEEALHRELFEEFGVKPLEFEKTRVGTALREHEGQPTHWVYINYKVLVDPKKIINGEPHKIDEMGWFTKDTLPQPLHSMFPIALEIAEEHNLLHSK